MSGECKCLTESQRWVCSLYLALAFMLISAPFMYRLTESLTDAVGLNTSSDGMPNMYGLVLHGLVFMCVVRLIMALPLPGKGKKH